MISFMFRRILVAIPLIFVILLINFAIIRAAPGDPAIIVAGPDAPAGYVMQVRKEMGLDKPIPEQLFIYIRDVLRGDLGYSWEWRRDVLGLILERLGATLLLMSVSMVISIVVGIFVGVMSSKKPFSKQDNITQVLSLIFASMPTFWTGMVVILIFGLYLGLFPTQGMMTIGLRGLDQWLDVAWHLILPATVVGLSRLALYSRLVRSSMLEVLGQDYILTAWSKGCSERTVFYKHALRNALLPIVTRIGMMLQSLFTGTVLVEVVFSWPGIGTLTFGSINSRDYNTVLSIFLIVSIITILGNLIADMLYFYVDPRTRKEKVS